MVTGARGFIASHLCQRLVAEGARVHGVSRSASVPDVRGVEWVRSDLVEPSSAERLLRAVRPDVVFHLAGCVTGSQEIGNVDRTLFENLTSTVHLMTAAVGLGRPRIVLAGSMQEPHRDDPAAVPCSPYAASKWASSGYARMFHALYGLPVTITRPFMVYGPGQWDSHKLLPSVILSLLDGRLPTIGSGQRELDWVFVDDVVEGMLVAADSEWVDATPIDLGTGELTSVRAIVERVFGIMAPHRQPQFGAIGDRPLERTHAARVDETRRMIGWSPATSLEQGLLRTVEWFRSQREATAGRAQ